MPLYLFSHLEDGIVSLTDEDIAAGVHVDSFSFNEVSPCGEVFSSCVVIYPFVVIYFITQDFCAEMPYKPLKEGLKIDINDFER